MAYIIILHNTTCILQLTKQNDNANILISDVQGRVLYQNNLDLINGANQKINLKNSALDGIFFVTIFNGNSILKSEKILFLE